MEMYQFIKQIGQGRYGDVWLVKGSKTRRNYVLKRIDLCRASKREQRAAHLEAKLLSTIKHPNVVAYLDSFYNSKGSLFIVMSYCEHGTLHDFIRNSSIFFEEEEIINWLVQICMALKYLHDQSILHRDIKTQNIFLSKQNLVKVGDFGISRIFNASEDTSTTLLTSPCYTSPEVFWGEAYEQKSDVWSLGCCVYEIAALRYAFLVQDISTLMQPIILTKLSTIPEMYSSELIHITLSMLNLDSDKRPTITELLLNDYIRKHILLFLRDSSHRSSSSQSCNCKIKCSPDSGINCDTSSSMYASEILKCADGKSKIREGMLKTIPDINGNGDGNDNSQQQSLSCDKTLSCKPKPPLYTNTSKGVLSSHVKPPKTTTESSNCGNNHDSETKTLVLNGHHVTNVKQLEKRLNFYTQKIKSENSFKLLNTLTNSINLSRFKNLDSFSEGGLSFPSVAKTKYNYGDNPPKSAEDFLSLSKKTHSEIFKRPATSGDISFGAMTSIQNGSCLPQINECANGTNAALRKSCVTNLPPLHNSEHLFCKNISERKDSLPNLEESIIDKFLLCNIMECNTQKDSASAVANPYFRQKYKFNEALSSSVPIKVETLCQECATGKS